MKKISADNRSYIPIHVEVWIASKLLSMKKELFTKQELLEIIQTEFDDFRQGVSTHISSVCVANKRPNHPKNYNYIYSVSWGVYRMLNNADDIHNKRLGSPSQPDLEDIPEHYRYLFDKSIASQQKPRIDQKKVRSDTSHPDYLLKKEEKSKGIEVDELLKSEREAIDRTLLMMAYNPSCARIFSTQVNLQIKNVIYSVIKQMRSATDQNSFDRIHKDILDEIVGSIENQKTGKSPKRITYGQAQKGLNVFLKVYVDWGNLPDIDTAATLKPLLHCPLDSIVMNSIKSQEPILYKKYGCPPGSMRGIVSYEQYKTWQKLCDEIVSISNCPKRTIIDILWYLGSQKEKLKSKKERASQ
jgi:hypothetical protein